MNILIHQKAGLDIEGERSAFEQCAKSVDAHLGKLPCGTYTDPITAAAWTGWLMKAKQGKAALGAAVAAIYFDDSSDYKSALFEVVKELGGVEAFELLENTPAVANLYK